jgi:pimeloyl-ACP methyl ester carboxylesterase
MPFVERQKRRLYLETIDRVPPWRADRATILLHHGVGARSEIWTNWIAELATEYRLVMFDMCGFGRSDVPGPSFQWSMDMLAEDVLAVADAAAAPRFHFVGESMGATIGLHCAIGSPARFQSLVLSNGSHIGGSIEKVQLWRDQIKQSGMAAWSDQFMKDRFYPDALTREKWDWFAQQQQAGDGNAVLGALGALVGTDLRPRLATVRQPVLLLHGDASPFIPTSIMADLHALLPQSDLQIFAHAKHGLPCSHGSQCAAVVREFLSRNFKDGQKPDQLA